MQATLSPPVSRFIAVAAFLEWADKNHLRIMLGKVRYPDAADLFRYFDQVCIRPAADPSSFRSHVMSEDGTIVWTPYFEPIPWNRAGIELPSTFWFLHYRLKGVEA